MLRRSFLVWAGATGLTAAGSGLAFQRWQEITPTLHYVGRDEGHFLRDRARAAAIASYPHRYRDSRLRRAGLTAAWKLKSWARPMC
jgi:hypothetical protein